MTYTPPQAYLERYANVLVNFGLRAAQPLDSGAIVWVNGPENAKPLFAEVWRAGGHVIREYDPSDDGDIKLTKDFYDLASDEQLDFFAGQYWRGLLEQCDHVVQILSPTDPKVLEGVPPEKIMRHQQSFTPVVQWQMAKEADGRFTFTIGVYGTEAMAAEAGLSLEDYWEQIVRACFLDEVDPVARWREVGARIAEYCQFLNSLPIERLHVEARDTDLWLALGEHRKWIGGSGRNIPSFEVFTSPDWRGTQGRISFNQPLYVHGSLIKGAQLVFRDGLVIEADAEKNEGLLKQMIGTEGADKVGEFSLTDARLSRITKFMANTLFDENTGGEFGNTHVAVGLSLRHCYDGDASGVSEEEWERLGFNTSSVHTDIVSTTDRTVTAVLKDGSERVIYSGGQFQSHAH